MRKAKCVGVVEVSAIDFDFGGNAKLCAGRKNSVQARNRQLLGGCWNERQQQEKSGEQAHPSVIEQKLLRVQQRPNDVFVGGAPGRQQFVFSEAGGFLLDVIDANLHFVRRGFAREGEHVKPANLVIVG